MSSANRQIARAAGTVMLSFGISKVVSLLANLLIARAFGTGGDVDAYLAANRFSETLYNLVAGGALASAFVPTFTALLAREERERAWRLASAVANLVMLVLAALGVVGAIFAPWVVRNLLASGFTDAAQIALTVALLRIQLLSAVIFGLSGLLMGVLNAHQSFLLPSLAPSLYSLGIILGVEVLAPKFGIYGVAWGVVLGAVLHLLVQIPGLLRLPKVRYIPDLGLHLPDVRQVLLLMGPRLLGVAVVQLNFWVNTLIASHLPIGSIAGITWAFSLMMMPQAAIAQSIATAALPTFSEQVARGKKEEMRASLAATLRSVLLLSIPASLGLLLLHQPLVVLVYQRGQFTSASTTMVAWGLLWYAAGLVGHCIVEVVSRAFYALHDTKTPVVLVVLSMALNIGFSLLFTRLFTWVGWLPLGGLALANSLATALESVGLLVIMRRRLNGLEGRHIWKGIAQYLLAGAGMTMALLLWLAWVGGQRAWLVALGGILVGGLVYGLILLLLRVDEIRWGLSLIQRLIGRKTS